MATPRHLDPVVIDALAEATHQEQSSSAVKLLNQHLCQTVTGADGVGISLVSGKGKIWTVGATDSTVEAADRFQYELNEGPCLDAYREETLVQVRDLRHDERWPQWARPVVEQIGYRSVLAVQLHSGTTRIGALNIYGRQVDAFEDDAVTALPGFALHAAAAINAVRKIEQLREAVDGRTEIGQAQGILMERLGLTADGAFALLRRHSQHRNEKLLAVAQELVHTGALPPDPTGGTEPSR